MSLAGFSFQPEGMAAAVLVRTEKLQDHEGVYYSSHGCAAVGNHPMGCSGADSTPRCPVRQCGKTRAWQGAACPAQPPQGTETRGGKVER